MKKNIAILTIGVVTTALMFVACSGGPAAQLDLKADSYGEADLANGVHLMVHPAKLAESPLVAFALRIPAGVDAEESGEAGYSSLLARLLARTGDGTAATTLAGMGSALTVEVQPDALLLSMTTLRDDAESAYTAVVAALNGEFAANNILAERDSLVSNLESATDPARDLLNATLYSGSPRAAKAGDRIEALKALTAESFAAFAGRVLRPNDMKIAVVGALDEQLLNAVVDESGKWAKAAEPEEAAAEEGAAEEEAEEDYTPIIVLNRPGTATALFLMRRLPGLDPERYYRFEAINLILNGQSTYGRLTGAQVALRLPIPINSTLDIRANDSSEVITTTVPTARAAEVFGAAMRELDRLHSGQVLNSRLTEQEIADARNFLSGQLMRQTETSTQLARFLVWSAANGFPGNQPQDHLATIEALDKTKLLETIERYFIPRLNALIAVGPADVLQKQFADFGTVKVVQ